MNQKQMNELTRCPECNADLERKEVCNKVVTYHAWDGKEWVVLYEDWCGETEVVLQCTECEWDDA